MAMNDPSTSARLDWVWWIGTSSVRPCSNSFADAAVFTLGNGSVDIRKKRGGSDQQDRTANDSDSFFFFNFTIIK